MRIFCSDCDFAYDDEHFSSLCPHRGFTGHPPAAEILYRNQIRAERAGTKYVPEHISPEMEKQAAKIWEQLRGSSKGDINSQRPSPDPKASSSPRADFYLGLAMGMFIIFCIWALTNFIQGVK